MSIFASISSIATIKSNKSQNVCGYSNSINTGKNQNALLGLGVSRLVSSLLGTVTQTVDVVTSTVSNTVDGINL